MSIAYEINRLNRNKQKVKEQVNVDKDIISEGREFIRDETVNHYSSGIKSMEMSYKDFIPVHTSTESLIETERGGTIISKTLKGNTSQNGTPTPSSPVPVNNVTGEQVVRVCGKNLFNYKQEPTLSLNNATSIIIENGLRIQSTSDGQWKSVLYRTNIDLREFEGKKFTLSLNMGTPSASNSNYVAIGNCNLTGTQRSTINQLFRTTGYITKTITIPTVTASKPYLYIVFSSNGDGTGVAGDYVDYTNIQIEQNTSATSYEEYQGKDYEINLGNIELNKIGNYQDYIRKGTEKNLFNKNAQPYKSNRYIDGSGQEGSSTEFSIFKTYLEPNTTYTITNSGASGTPGYVLFNSSGERVGGSNYSNRSHITFTTTNDTSYMLESVVINASSTRYDLNIFQIEQGSIATSYEPYGYKWYIEKNIGKTIVNGSENFSRQVLSNDIVRFMFTGNVEGIGDTRQTIFSNYFVANLNSANDREGIGFVYGNLLYLYKQEASVADFQSWLNTHNTLVYYVLNTPEYTLIENEELIEQLEKIMPLLEGQNNISVSGNLPTGIDVDYIERVNKHLIGNTNESAE